MSIETVKMVDERPDWLDGATDIELSTHHLRAYWDADILDIDDRNKHDTIIERRDPFEFRFRVYLRGRVWKCICGHWCFDVGFTSIGDGQDFNLSDVLRTMQVWSGWDAAPVCGWMRGQLDQAADAGAQPAEEPPTEEPAAEPAAEPAPARAAPTPGPASRTQLRIDSAALIDAAGRTEVVTAGALAANPRTELVAPVRVVFAVGGAPPGTPLQAVARIRHPDGPGWNPRDPVVLIAWAPDATAKPVSVTLPSVTIRPEPG